VPGRLVGVASAEADVARSAEHLIGGTFDPQFFGRDLQLFFELRLLTFREFGSRFAGTAAAPASFREFRRERRTGVARRAAEFSDLPFEFFEHELDVGAFAALAAQADGA